MSYHILQQFDESLLSEITDSKRAENDVEFCRALLKRRENRLMSLAGKKITAREWFLIIIAVVAVTGSLFYSVSVTRQLDQLQERLARLESASSAQQR
jgi:cell division protein FtsL